MKNLTQERLREVLSYDPVTGIFTWLKQLHVSRIGNRAGSATKDGYLTICIDQVRYPAHRLAWFYVFGTWPVFDIDHIDSDRKNNAIANLRDVPRADNLQNRRTPYRTNSHGFLGVTKSRSKSKPWMASIQAFGKRRHIDVFATQEEAHAAYLKAKAELHPSFPHKGV